MPVRWTPEMIEKLFLAICNQMPDFKVDWEQVAAELGHGLKPRAVAEQFRLFKVRARAGQAQRSDDKSSGKSGVKSPGKVVKPTKKRKVDKTEANHNEADDDDD